MTITGISTQTSEKGGKIQKASDWFKKSPDKNGNNGWQRD